MNLQEKIKNEGDEFEFEYKGLNCYMKRHGGSLHWCGYVSVPKGSRLEKALTYYSSDSELGISEFEQAVNDIDVHGGITYNGERKGDGVVYRGFDCAHLGDLSPGWDMEDGEDVYRDKEYVVQECKHLADQILKITALYK